MFSCFSIEIKTKSQPKVAPSLQQRTDSSPQESVIKLRISS